MGRSWPFGLCSYSTMPGQKPIQSFIDAEAIKRAHECLNIFSLFSGASISSSQTNRR